MIWNIRLHNEVGKHVNQVFKTEVSVDLVVYTEYL